MAMQQVVITQTAINESALPDCLTAESGPSPADKIHPESEITMETHQLDIMHTVITDSALTNAAPYPYPVEVNV